MHLAVLDLGWQTGRPLLPGLRSVCNLLPTCPRENHPEPYPAGCSWRRGAGREAPRCRGSAAGVRNSGPWVPAVPSTAPRRLPQWCTRAMGRAEVSLGEADWCGRLCPHPSAPRTGRSSVFHKGPHMQTVGSRGWLLRTASECQEGTGLGPRGRGWRLLLSLPEEQEELGLQSCCLRCPALPQPLSSCPTFFPAQLSMSAR